MNESPNFYAVIPAHVLYNKDLNANQKILYAEISGLANKEGFCWAQNKYFAELHDVDERSIQNWLKKLRDLDLIKISFTYKPDSKEIAERRIWIINAKEATEPNSELPVQEADQPILQAQNVPEPDSLPFEPPAESQSGEGVKIFSGGGEKFFGRGGENSFADNNINSFNTINLSSSSPPTPKLENPQNPPEEEAAFKLSQKIKAECQRMDNDLILDGKFYSKAACFLSRLRLPIAYIPFLYAQCKKQSPKSMRNYFYRMFFEGQFVELYRAQFCKPPEIPKPQPIAVVCPVCGETNAGGVNSCSKCGFDLPQKDNPLAVREAKVVFALPEDLKTAYQRELQNIYADKTMDFTLKLQKMGDIKKRFGVLVA